MEHEDGSIHTVQSIQVLALGVLADDQAISRTRLNVQRLIFGIVYEESSVGPKALGNGNHAERL
jgi:hypothetical protein